MSHLFTPLRLGELRLANRIVVAPMCQYSATDGTAGDWHMIHLGQLALSGAGLLVLEATAVSPEGRITPQDAGIWSEAHTAAWARIVDFVHARGALIGTQLAHAGRKASTFRPWDERSGSVPVDEGGWATSGPSVEPFPGYAPPVAMTPSEIDDEAHVVLRGTAARALPLLLDEASPGD